MFASVFLLLLFFIKIFHSPVLLSVLNAIKRTAQAMNAVLCLFQLDSNVNIKISDKLNRMLLCCDTMKLVKSH